MWTKNTIWTGLLAGVLVPFVGYAVLLMLAEKFQVYFLPEQSPNDPVFDSMTLQVIALCGNLIPMHLFNRRHFAQAMRGVVFSTLGYAVVWFVLFGVEIFQN